METLLRANLARVHQRIALACDRAGRQPDEVTLVAVTKYATPEVIEALVSCGHQVLGESRPQRLWQLSQSLDPHIEWHLIGHLQTNKVARTLPLVSLIHSVDSQRLLQAIDREAQAQELTARCLLEVNISGEPTKQGWPPDRLADALQIAAELPRVQVVGLMAMASLEGGQDRAAAEFAQVRQLRDRLRCECPNGSQLQELSMGMSGDFEVAIEQGATLVRVGSALFEK